MRFGQRSDHSARKYATMYGTFVIFSAQEVHQWYLASLTAERHAPPSPLFPQRGEVELLMLAHHFIADEVRERDPQQANWPTFLEQLIEQRSRRPHNGIPILDRTWCGEAAGHKA